MHRIRLLRILIPIVSLGLVAAIVIAVRARPQRGSIPADPSTETGSRMEGFRFSDLVQGRRRLLVQAKVGRVDDQGAFEVEQVERVEVDREDQSPLVLTAARGGGSGAQGKRIVRLDGGVTMEDHDSNLELEIPSVEIDQVVGIVRSLGAVKLSSGAWRGTAAAVVHDLNGTGTRITDLLLEGAGGGRLAARTVTIPPGSLVLRLEGAVEASQNGMALHADNIVVVRGPEGRLESVTATPAVTGTAPGVEGGAVRFSAQEARASWDAGGRPVGVLLAGSARVEHARGSISAGRIDAKALEAAGATAIDAQDEVAVTGTTPKGVGHLTCAALHAMLDGQGAVRDGVATGNVRFDGDGAAGEAAEARFTSLDAEGTVTLAASADRRARLASGRIRIVANSIVTDIHGNKLAAEGRVESTLLPAPTARASRTSPMFASSDAVHFVSAFLDSFNAGARLVLRGDVRGWQGDRTLSGDEVEMIQDGEVLNARGHVATRMPRESTRAATEADYMQIGADRLDYRGGAHHAEYGGNVRVRQAEGWLETPRLTASLAEGGPGLREIQASDGVKFEYRAPGDKGVPTTATGNGDRAVYDSVARVLRVFGDSGPATVRSTGPNAGTTVGRVLRYEMDTGALEVESGERDRATIRTQKN